MTTAPCPKCQAIVTINVQDLGQNADGLHRLMVDATHAAPLCADWTAGAVDVLKLEAGAV